MYIYYLLIGEEESWEDPWPLLTFWNKFFRSRNEIPIRTRKSFENETGKFKWAKLPTRVHHRTCDETISASRLSSPFSSPCSPAAITLRYHCHPGWLHGAHHDSKFTKSSLAKITKNLAPSLWILPGDSSLFSKTWTMFIPLKFST